ncbi:MAG: ornithine carbamoyltransferase [Aggregatilineales bacterium]
MRHLINLSDWPSEDIRHLLELGGELKHQQRNGGNPPILRGKTLALVFQKPSLRTRVSFEVGMAQLGGCAVMLGPDEIRLGKRESVADVARSLSRLVDGIMARVFAHSDVIELARYATVPVINGLSDTHHPCQALADALTIQERLGSVQGRRIAYVGDGNNVAVSLAQVVAHLGGHFAIGTPPGYEIPEEDLAAIAEIAKRHGSQIELYHNPVDAVRGADVVYTDTWVSMGQEAETARRLEVMAPFQVNQELLEHVSPNAIVMHCLPAHRGQEITDEVAEGPRSVIFDQVENRLHMQKAVLVKLMS